MIAVILPSRGLTSTPEGKKVYMREYRQRKKDEIKASRRAYFLANKERENATRRELRKKNPDYAENDRASSKKWREANKDYFNEYRREYHKKNYTGDSPYRLKMILRCRLRRAIVNNQKAGSAVADLGCSIPELITHLENKFVEGMSWDNWGEWQIDHIKPLAKFDLSDRQQFVQATHFTNLQPLWRADNQRKGAR